MEKKVKVTEKDLEVAFGYKEVEISRSQAEDWNRDQVEGERGWAMRGWKWLPGRQGGDLLILQQGFSILASGSPFQTSRVQSME